MQSKKIFFLPYKNFSYKLLQKSNKIFFFNWLSMFKKLSWFNNSLKIIISQLINKYMSLSKCLNQQDTVTLNNFWTKITAEPRQLKYVYERAFLRILRQSIHWTVNYSEYYSQALFSESWDTITWQNTLHGNNIMS